MEDDQSLEWEAEMVKVDPKCSDLGRVRSDVSGRR